MRLKVWLSLSLAVLLVHLALMQTLLSDLPLGQTPTGPTFATRTVLLSRAPTPAPTQTAAPQQVKPKAKLAPTRKPVAQTKLAPESLLPENNAATLASADSGATDTQAQPIAMAADKPASAPESAAEPRLEAVASAALPDAGTPMATTDAAFHADALPASIKLVYRVDANKFPFRLSSELLWQQHEGSYQARLSISAFGQSRVQTSRGQIDPSGLAPERFSDKSRSEVAAHFNRAQGVVSFSANTPSIPLQPGAQDRLSVLVQIAALVASDPKAFSPGTTLRVQTIGPREADLWLFTFGDMEALELPGGPQQGIKLVRQPRQPYDQKLEVWLAPGLAYLPARIRITETNGDYVDQKWESSEAADSP